MAVDEETYDCRSNGHTSSSSCHLSHLDKSKRKKIFVSFAFKIDRGEVNVPMMVVQMQLERPQPMVLHGLELAWLVVALHGLERPVVEPDEMMQSTLACKWKIPIINIQSSSYLCD